jgi:hypothetical protein
MQSWVQHVKSYCASKGISYKNALRDPQCKESYHSAKSTSNPTETPSNPESKKRTSRIKIPVVEETIDIAHDSMMDSNSMGKNKKNPLLNMDPTSNPTPDESMENTDNLSNFTKNKAPKRNNKKLPTMGLF